MLKPYNVADVTFELRREIGTEGRNSSVFVAHDPQLDAELVIKRISKANLDVDGYFSESACIYASSHSNVVPIHYACQDDESIYLAMPHYVRGSLKQLMSQRFLTVREIVTLATQLLSGLHNIHTKGFVHFDVKPDNILLSDRGEALIADFGLARARDLNGLVEQDRHYGKMVPPEFFTQEEYDHRYDIYQVGLTLFRMCVGDVVFYEQFRTYMPGGQFDRLLFRHAVINNQFPNTESDVFPEHIPDTLIRVIRKCLEGVDDRYKSCVDVVNGLAGIEGELLDWQYAKDPGGTTWVKRIDDMITTLHVAPNRSSVAKKGRVDGQERRINEYCVESLSRQRTKRFLREN